MKYKPTDYQDLYIKSVTLASQLEIDLDKAKLSLRDQLAMAALTGYMSQSDGRAYNAAKADGKTFEEWCNHLVENDAAYCYRMADAMLKASGRNDK